MPNDPRTARRRRKTKESHEEAWARVERERKASLLEDKASPLAAALRVIDEAVRDGKAFERYARDQARSELSSLVEKWGRLLRNNGTPWHAKGLRIRTERCAVTAFDAKISLSRDGRRRGIWFWFNDSGRQIPGQDRHVSEAVLLEWPAARRMLNAYTKAMREASRKAPPSIRPRRRRTKQARR